MTFSKSEVVGVDDCPVPCEELELSVVSSFHELSHSKKTKKKKKKNEWIICRNKTSNKDGGNDEENDKNNGKSADGSYDENDDTEYHEEEDEEDEDEDVEQVYRVDIQYVNIDSYRSVEEKQLYSWDQIAGEVGGFLGLVIGASFISVIEIVLYLILCCISK